MALNPPRAGLRTIHYWGVSTWKGQVNVSLGDELTVPDTVAEQLLAQSPQFKDGPAPELPVVADVAEGESAPVETADAPKGRGRRSK